MIVYGLIVMAAILYLIGSNEISKDKKITVKTSTPGVDIKSGITPGDVIQEQEADFFEDTMSIIKKGIETVIKPVKKLLTRANRNNNPGNLRYAKQTEAIGQDSGGFATFKTVQDGWEALEKQINLDKSRGLTLSTFIYKYAPASENVTSAYLSYLIKGTGEKADTPLNDIDTATLASLIAKYEGYVGGYFA